MSLSLDNMQCALYYSNNRFFIFAWASSTFQLFILETTFVTSLNSVLCKQKGFVYNLKLF